jgi:hypothetical protein
MSPRIQTPRLLDALAALSPIATVPSMGIVYYLMEPNIGHDSLTASMLAFILVGLVPVLIYMWRFERHLAKTWRRNMAVCGLLAGYWFAGMIAIWSTDPGSAAMRGSVGSFLYFALFYLFYKTEIDIFHYDGTFSLGGRETTLRDSASSGADVSNRQSGQIVSN